MRRTSASETVLLRPRNASRHVVVCALLFLAACQSRPREACLPDTTPPPDAEPPSLTAREISLVGPDGKTQIRLAATDAGPELQMFDYRGRALLEAGIGHSMIVGSDVIRPIVHLTLGAPEIGVVRLMNRPSGSERYPWIQSIDVTAARTKGKSPGGISCMVFGEDKAAVILDDTGKRKLRVNLNNRRMKVERIEDD